MQEEVIINTWVKWFKYMNPIGKYYVKVSEDYLKDQFNAYGCLKKLERRFKISREESTRIMELICGPFPADHYTLNENELGIYLYGLIHARFLRTKHGLDLMYDNYQHDIYEVCPNANCRKMCFPIGLKEELGYNLFMYCPYCGEIYYPQNPEFYKIDGSAFESTYILPFYHMNREIAPTAYPPEPEIKLFGFKVEDPVQEIEEEEEEDSEGVGGKGQL